VGAALRLATGDAVMVSRSLLNWKPTQ
jgi:hypothetical protein